MTVDVADAAEHAHYRHEAFFYASGDEFLDVSLRFIRDAIASNEPILVVLTGEKIANIRSCLQSQSSAVLFADMSEVGDNPAHIIPAWDDFLHANRDRRVRGIGEPIVSALDPAKLAECHRHEALLNIAFADPAFWLLCPYDTTALGGAEIEQARRTHPVVMESGTSQSSAEFAGYEALCEPCRDPLPDPPKGVTSLTFEQGDLSDVRVYIAAIAAKAGMAQHRVDDLVLAANEIATNSLRHGGSRGSIRAWDEPGSMICEISDNGLIWNPLTGRLRPSVHRGGGRGLWLANQVCDLVQIRSLESGNVVRLHVRCS